MGKSKKKKKKKKQRSAPMAKNNAIDLDKLFCINAKKYKIPKILLKSVAMVESALDPRAYRYEKDFFKRYMENHPLWQDKDPERYSASYGVMQLMYVVAWELGFRDEPEELYNPVYNIELGAKLLRRHLNKIKTVKNIAPYINFWPRDLALAWYNGGRKNNPTVEGNLRNPEYVDKVKIEFWKLVAAGEEECT